MKKTLLTALLAALLLLSACGAPAAPAAGPAEDDGTLHILATTYPVYLFATAVTEGVEGVEVTQLVNQQTACLHDYTLTVNDMKAVGKADVILLSGAGLEDFLSDALAASDAAVIDCSEGLDLLPALGHEGHDHETEYDPHIWMDPANARVMMNNISSGLSALDEARAEDFTENFNEASALLPWDISLSGRVGSTGLITFHDGFQYFARAAGLTLLKSIEEEEGAEASAAEIKEIVELIRTHDVPAIFTEKNGPTATAEAIARETGVKVCQLDMIMSGDGTGIQPYLDAINANLDTIAEAFQ